MHSNNINNKEFELIETMLAYFNPLVLSSYKDQPDKYILNFDEGELRIREDYFYELEEKGKTNQSISIRFGYRKLKDGDKVLVIWLNDLIELSRSHIQIWMAFRIRNLKWMEYDETFKKWYSRNIDAKVVKSGPLYELAETIKKINIFTNESVGKSLYQHEVDLSLPFPIAENTHKYQDSHEDLYRYLIDGLNKNCIDDIAANRGLNINFGDKTTFNTLLKIFPKLSTSKFKDAMNNVSEQRRLAGHNVRPLLKSSVRSNNLN